MFLPEFTATAVVHCGALKARWLLIYPASMLKLYFVFHLFLLYNSNANIYFNVVIIKTELPVFAPTTDVSSSSPLT